MRSSVRDGFVSFTTPLEGKISHMYLDVLGLVTTGIGNLIDTSGPGGVAYALPLPWKRKDGTAATQAEIATEWNAIKSRKDLALRGGGAFKAIATLHLDDDGVKELVSKKLAQNDVHLKGRFADFESWPADAQLAVHSMAWACGAGFRFPMLEVALRAANFRMAALECKINETGNPGIKPRNVANQILFRNAARVLEDKLDPETLYYPQDLTARPPVHDLMTVRGYQARLAELGYYTDKVDGVHGPMTEAAVKKFQSDFGLTVDGRVGPMTRAALA